MNDNEYLKIFKESHNIAVVGLSSNPWRPSYGVSDYMQRAGYNIIPVNPNYSEVLGHKSYPSLRDIPERVDIVDVFRNSSHVLEVIDDAIAIGAKVIWLQLGVSSPEGIDRARAAGLQVVEDHCIKIEHARLRSALA